MKRRKTTGNLSFEVVTDLPSYVCIPKESKTSVAKLRRTVTSLFNRASLPSDKEKLRQVLEIIEKITACDGLVTRIQEKDSKLFLWIRFDDTLHSKSFTNVISKRKIKCLSVKMELHIDENPSSRNLDEAEMLDFIRKSDDLFYDAVKSTYGIISKAYIKNPETISVWVSFIRLRNLKDFLEIIKYCRRMSKN